MQYIPSTASGSNSYRHWHHARRETAPQSARVDWKPVEDSHLVKRCSFVRIKHILLPGHIPVTMTLRESFQKASWVGWNALEKTPACLTPACFGVYDEFPALYEVFHVLLPSSNSFVACASMRYLVTWLHWLYFLHEQTPEPIHQKIANFCPFHRFWSIFAAVEQRSLLVQPWISTAFLCIVKTRCQVDKSFTKTSSMPCWDLIIHILPLGAAESHEVFTSATARWSDPPWTLRLEKNRNPWENMPWRICHWYPLIVFMYSTFGTRFQESSFFETAPCGKLIKITRCWRLCDTCFGAASFFGLSFGNWKSTYRWFHLHAWTQVKLLEYYDEEEQLNFRRSSLVFGDTFLLKGNL